VYLGAYGSVEEYVVEEGSKPLLSVEAEQACAYDRAHFGRPGTGRISIGIYHAFIHKWLQVNYQIVCVEVIIMDKRCFIYYYYFDSPILSIYLKTPPHVFHYKSDNIHTHIYKY
jgi:hypothetical protein